MSLEDLIIHIRIEKQNRNRDNVEKAKELSSKANALEEKSKPKNNRKRTKKSNSKGNLAETEMILAVVSFKEGDEQVFMGDSRSTPVIGKGKVLFKLNYGKVFALGDVLHVPDIHWNLVSVSLLGKAGVRILFDSNKTGLTNNDEFVG
ncbi:hypothetical protein CK203_101445 [Vitis vinifera]|uniref:Retrovirus-related Pol polyprotein from transposon TNT 1-94-like beta-barrel domain-containing protein n=1 Tax=Vitis vinifera TaxID=29760 RepID=A0A438BRQ5_VITVI|nr:hypothetical protein CK203_101445 [Vitis vinifera]